MVKWPNIDTEQLPSQSKVSAALLLLLFRRTRPIHASEAYEQLAQQFDLTQRQRHAVMKTTKENAWENRVRQARRHLVEEQLLDGSERDQWKLTKFGWQYAWSIENPGQLLPGVSFIDL